MITPPLLLLCSIVACCRLAQAVPIPSPTYGQDVQAEKKAGHRDETGRRMIISRHHDSPRADERVSKIKERHDNKRREKMSKMENRHDVVKSSDSSDEERHFGEMWKQQNDDFRSYQQHREMANKKLMASRRASYHARPDRTFDQAMSQHTQGIDSSQPLPYHHGNLDLHHPRPHQSEVRSDVKGTLSEVRSDVKGKVQKVEQESQEKVGKGKKKTGKSAVRSHTKHTKAEKDSSTDRYWFYGGWGGNTNSRNCDSGSSSCHSSPRHSVAGSEALTQSDSSHMCGPNGCFGSADDGTSGGSGGLLSDPGKIVNAVSSGCSEAASCVGDLASCCGDCIGGLLDCCLSVPCGDSY